MRAYAIEPGTQVKVKKEESTVVSEANRNRTVAVYSNDSANVIYLKFGEKAEKEKGIRLNKEGGSIIVDFYNGEVTAYSALESVLCVVEV